MPSPVAPSASRNLPIGHLKHVYAPGISLYFPAAHSRQTDTSAAPKVSEYFPMAQSEQKCPPEAVLNFPATHGAQCSPFEPKNPALHAHSSGEGLPGGASEAAGHCEQFACVLDPTCTLYFACAQSEQGPAPGAVLYFPGRHCVHIPALCAVAPASQTHCAIVELPGSEIANAEHVEHVDSAVAPIAAEYVPCEQSLHSADP